MGLDGTILTQLLKTDSETKYKKQKVLGTGGGTLTILAIQKRKIRKIISLQPAQANSL